MNSISTVLILATEAPGAGEGGFGLEFNILEANLINLAILVGVLIYFGGKSLGTILSERRAKIAEEIQEAEERQKKAAEALADGQQKLAQAQAEAERIRQTAAERAQAAKAAIAAQAEIDVQRLQEAAVKDLNAEQERVMTELRQRIAAMAIERAEARLTALLDESSQQTLIDRSIAQLGG
jgi:F-type H+-transporting ATPase subunit b